MGRRSIARLFHPPEGISSAGFLPQGCLPKNNKSFCRREEDERFGRQFPEVVSGSVRRYVSFCEPDRLQVFDLYCSRPEQPVFCRLLTDFPCEFEFVVSEKPKSKVQMFFY